jgi:hypothetical protein
MAEFGNSAGVAETRSGWIFVNFHYSYYSEDGKTKAVYTEDGKTKDLPDDDLIHILSQ